MPNIQIDVGQIKMRAIDFFVPTPSKIAKSWEIIYFLTNNHAIYWKDQKLASSFWLIMPNIGLKVAAAFSFWSRTAESPIVNIFAKTILG